MTGKNVKGENKEGAEKKKIIKSRESSNKRYIQKGQQKRETNEKQIFKKENKTDKNNTPNFFWSKAERKDKRAKHIHI